MVSNSDFEYVLNLFRVLQDDPRYPPGRRAEEKPKDKEKLQNKNGLLE